MANRLIALAVTLAAWFMATAAFAAPVTWTIPSTSFGGGREISGSFIFDAALPAADRLISIDVVETGPTPTHYTHVSGQNGTVYFALAVPVATTSDRTIAFSLTGIPATVGSSFTVPQIVVNQCLIVVAGKCTDVFISPSATNVVITSSAPPAPVPTMSEWAMILFGGLLLAGSAYTLQRRRQLV